jgi:hypothetical protein
LLIAAAAPEATLPAIAQHLRDNSEWIPKGEEELQELVVAIAGSSVAGSTQQIIRLGVRAVPIHRAIADIAGLPAGWLDAQNAVIEPILEPLRDGKEYRGARLRVPAENGDPEEDALEWLGRSLQPSAAAGHLIYLRAEAGKGKSTIFAEHANRHLQKNDGPLPLMIPLRNLRRGTGASWETIAASVGVVGRAVTDFSRAVKAGLVTLLLDGLDEVSGRYDPAVIQDIARAVSDQVLGDSAALAFSGRTTEGMLLDPKNTYQRTIELPGIDGVEFRTYVERVVDAVVPGWPTLAQDVGEPISTEELRDREMTGADREHLISWVLHNFTDFGKDRSLFFVQSLACLARDMQLRGNKPMFVKQAGAAPVVIACGLYEACLCAVSLACVREQGKVVPESQIFFTPAKQRDVATWFAVLASVDDVVRSRFPTPNALIAEVFGLDPVNQPEELVSILRQVQKHALFYASGGPVGGDWRPAFLSDWVRSALIVRAWIRRNEMGITHVTSLTKAIVVAQRARNAYHNIFPDRIMHEKDVRLDHLVAALIAEADAGSPEACENFWCLLQGLSNEARSEVTVRPRSIVEGADFNEFEFDGLDFGPEFSANLAFFARTQFSGCRFKGCKFTSCDFTEASFVSCTFDGVSFEHCDGVIRFEDCEDINATQFVEVRTRQLPAWMFTNCHFAQDSRICQANVPCKHQYGPIAVFDDCTSDEDPSSVLVGPELGQYTRQFDGLRHRTSDAGTDPGIACLRQLLRPFFPSRVGLEGTRQARDYIRSSSLGRGSFPAGSPSPKQLTSFLNAEGFTTGGRQRHLYAPWSDVAGATRVDLRGEFSAFLRDQNAQGATIVALLAKIRESAAWHAGR